MKILSIGNSFSMNAQHYLNRISVLNNRPIKSVNLYIGGCSLRTHYFNMLENAKKYDFQFNGASTGLNVTIKDALMSDSWDYVTFQQVSTQSVNIDTYEPYLTKLSEYVSIYAPQAKKLIHQTWQYDQKVLNERKTADTVEEMFEKIKEASIKAAKIINAEGIIPAGAAINEIVRSGLSPHSDGAHLGNGSGKLCAGLLWYSYLTSQNPEDVILPAPDAPVTEDEIAIIRKAVKDVLFN